jgi:hypothetical protein
MKDADVLFIHINIMMSWQAMKQRELPCHDDEETDDEDFRIGSVCIKTLVCRL